MYKKVAPILLSALLAMILAGCAEEQPQGSTAATGSSAPGDTGAAVGTTTSATSAGETTVSGGTTGGGTTVTETTGATTGTTGGSSGGTTGGGTTVSASGGEAAVGGFVVETPNAPDTTVPEANVSQQDAREYLDEVQPVIESSVQDFSNLANQEVSVQDGNLTLAVPVDSLENTRSDVRDGLDQLRQIEPPQNLQPINQQLIESYERVLPAYTDIIEAANDGDGGRLSNAVQENLPRIERFNSEGRGILQDLEQAAGTQ